MLDIFNCGSGVCVGGGGALKSLHMWNVHGPFANVTFSPLFLKFGGYPQDHPPPPLVTLGPLKVLKVSKSTTNSHSIKIKAG